MQLKYTTAVTTPHALTMPAATAVPASVAMMGMDLTAVCFVFMYIRDCMLHIIIVFMLIYVSIIRNTHNGLQCVYV